MGKVCGMPTILEERIDKGIAGEKKLRAIDLVIGIYQSFVPERVRLDA